VRSEALAGLGTESFGERCGRLQSRRELENVVACDRREEKNRRGTKTQESFSTMGQTKRNTGEAQAYGARLKAGFTRAPANAPPAIGTSTYDSKKRGHTATGASSAKGSQGLGGKKGRSFRSLREVNDPRRPRI